MTLSHLNLPIRPASKAEAHPLASLSAAEIEQCSQLVRARYLPNVSLFFKHITLHEPAKAELMPYLELEHSGKATSQANIDRRAFVNYYIKNTDQFFEGVVNLSKNSVERHMRLGPYKHGVVNNEELISAEHVILNDPGVKEVLAQLQLPKNTQFVIDPWSYGSDGEGDDKRWFQCFMYIQDPAQPSNPDSNHYAFPVPISPVYDTINMKVVRIDVMPTGVDSTVKPLQPFESRPPNEYLPELVATRTDLKPLNVVQPEGASFKVSKAPGDLETVEWQKWFFRVGFNAREGITIHDVRYDGRPLFYRLSLSEMSIPYSDPRHPFNKKCAFDLGDVGAGVMANNLRLGCDCLGSIHYVSGVLNDREGKALPMPNVICIHEQDAGIGWKHTNYRTGRACVVRARELVVQSIITVANYEYILAFVFGQAGQLEYETRATGILSTQPADLELQDADIPWGTIVHPGVLAGYHQHIFSLRIDPMIDGSHTNRLVYEECVPVGKDEKHNRHGVGYTMTETVVEKSCGLDLDVDKGRVFKIQNVASRNPINGAPVSFKLHLPSFQKILAAPDSFHARRAQFTDHNIYVTRYRDHELYAAGRYTMQSRGDRLRFDDNGGNGDNDDGGVDRTPAEHGWGGVRDMAAREDDVRDQDIVVWAQFGIQHVPRVEDFPVMPSEIMRVGLKPANFFSKNPALDVPPSTQEVNRSVLVNGANGEACCNGK